MKKPERQLSTADERRREVVRAAASAFGERGYYGTSTIDIAARAGISQAYLYRLFPNKKALFIAALAQVKLRLRETIGQAATAASRDRPDMTGQELIRDVTTRMSQETDPNAAMVLLHANAAVGEPEILGAVIDCYRDQVTFLRETFGASDPDIYEFIANGQLMNTVTVLQLDSAHQPWASALTTPFR